MTVFFFRSIFLTCFSKILISSSARIRDTLLKTLTGTRRTSCCCWGGFLHVSPGTFVLFFWTLWEEELSGRGAQILCSIVFFFSRMSGHQRCPFTQKKQALSVHLKEHLSFTTCLWQPLRKVNMVVRGSAWIKNHLRFGQNDNRHDSRWNSESDLYREKIRYFAPSVLPCYWKKEISSQQRSKRFHSGQPLLLGLPTPHPC